MKILRNVALISTIALGAMSTAQAQGPTHPHAKAAATSAARKADTEKAPKADVKAPHAHASAPRSPRTSAAHK